MYIHAFKQTFSACKGLKFVLVVYRFLMQFNIGGATLDMHHKSKFITSACLVMQQTHEASRVHILSSTTGGMPEMHNTNKLFTSTITMQ